MEFLKLMELEEEGVPFGRYVQWLAVRSALRFATV